MTLDVDQFYGIEIEEFPAQIAQVALWLVDHQMNTQVSEEFGNYFARIPLVSTPPIVNGNALRIDWDSVLPRERCSYVLGNPPFVGAMVMSESQRADIAPVFSDLKGYGILDSTIKVTGDRSGAGQPAGVRLTARLRFVHNVPRKHQEGV